VGIAPPALCKSPDGRRVFGCGDFYLYPDEISGGAMTLHSLVGVLQLLFPVTLGFPLPGKFSCRSPLIAVAQSASKIAFPVTGISAFPVTQDFCFR
jgi:hypothetical protein